MDAPEYIAIDPGKLSGYATFNKVGDCLDIDYLTEDELRTRFQEDIKYAKAVICENWLLDPKLAKVFAWSPMPTCKLIGWLEGVCTILKTEFVLQAANCKPTGYRLAGKKPLPKSNPLNHGRDAEIHGVYYLVNKGIILPRR